MLAFREERAGLQVRMVHSPFLPSVPTRKQQNSYLVVGQAKISQLWERRGQCLVPCF